MTAVKTTGRYVPVTQSMLEDARLWEESLMVTLNGGYMAPRLIDYWHRHGGYAAFLAFRMGLRYKVALS